MKKKMIAEVNNLTVRFRSKKGAFVTAVDDISFALREGETLAVVGESGSGKTTLLRALLRIVEPASGSVRLFGRDLSQLSVKELADVRRQCGYVPQDPYGALPPGLSALGAVMEPDLIAHSARTKEESRARAENLLAELGLHGERILGSRAVGLSGGQRQRVEIARALMLGPKLLLCDEPTSMQDASTRGEIIEILEKYVKTAMAMLFITHDLLLAGRVAEHIMVMKNGALCEAGLSREILQNPRHPYTKALLDAVPRIANRQSVI